MTNNAFRTLLRFGAVPLVLAGALLAVPAAAAAAATSDTTPPTATLEPFARYVAGSTADTFYGSAGDMQYFALSMVIKWTASDASGICRQRLTEQSYDTYGGDPDPILGGDTATYSVPLSARSHAFAENYWDYWRIPHRFVLRVTDCAGNTAVSGISTTSINFAEDNSPAMTYAGPWHTSHFTGFSGGTTHFASAPGASVSFKVNGGPVALVMEKAANRGSAKIFVDGVFRMSVNTNSATTMHRRVVWQALLPAGNHTVEVVNSATPGHPRVDLDLVLD